MFILGRNAAAEPSSLSPLHTYTYSHDDVIKWKHFIPLTKASDVELWCFIWSAPEQTAEQSVETPIILDAIALIMTLL